MSKTLIDQNLGEQLIFLISQPRAGSTMLQRVLFSHSEVNASAEPWIMLHPLYALKRKGYSAEYDSRVAKEALDDFLGNLMNGEDVYIEAIRKMALFLYETTLEKSGKAYFLDKTPRYYFIIPELYKIFPKAKFIFLIRNPLAVLSSVLESWVKEDWKLLSNYKDDLLKAPRLIIDGINLLKNDAIVISYEKLVENPKKEIKSLCEKLQIEFQSTMLEYGNDSQPEGRMGDQIEIHKHSKPVADYINKWASKLNTPYVKGLAEIYLATIGYEIVENMGYSSNKLFNALSDKGEDENFDEKLLERIISHLGISHSENLSLNGGNAKFTQGFYEDEGGFRWIKKEGNIFLWGLSLDKPLSIKLALTCGNSGLYKQFPFAIDLYKDKKLFKSVHFERSGQIEQVEIPIEQEKSVANIFIKSEQVFIPSASGDSNDDREMSVQLSNLEIGQV